MFDILTQLYYLVDENLPGYPYLSDIEDTFLATLTPEQQPLFEAYQMEAFQRNDTERRILFNYLVKLGLHIP